MSPSPTDAYSSVAGTKCCSCCPGCASREFRQREGVSGWAETDLWAVAAAARVIKVLLCNLCACLYCAEWGLFSVGVQIDDRILQIPGPVGRLLVAPCHAEHCVEPCMLVLWGPGRLALRGLPFHSVPMSQSGPCPCCRHRSCCRPAWCPAASGPHWQEPIAFPPGAPFLDVVSIAEGVLPPSCIAGTPGLTTTPRSPSPPSSGCTIGASAATGTSTASWPSSTQTSSWCCKTIDTSACQTSCATMSPLEVSWVPCNAFSASAVLSVVLWNHKYWPAALSLVRVGW